MTPEWFLVVLFLVGWANGFWVAWMVFRVIPDRKVRRAAISQREAVRKHGSWWDR